MKPPRNYEQRSGCWRWVALLAAAAAIAYAFREEFSLLWNIARSLVNDPAGTLAFLPLEPFIALAAFAAAAVLTYWIYLFIISQVLFPISKSGDRLKAFMRLVYYRTRSHGVAIVVRDGKQVARPDELRRTLPGVAIVDNSSAIVLEQQSVAAYRKAGQEDEKQPSGRRMLVSQSQRRPTYVRVEGPGIVFTDFNEKVRGVADLRKQHRLNPGVHAYTSDGIEIETDISVTFSLGQPAKVMKVTCLGNSAQDVRVVVVDSRTKVITAISEELDAEDKAEIFAFATRRNPFAIPTAPLLPDEDPRQHPPFLIDPDRIFAAIYSQAHNVAASSLDDWTSLPAQVATEVFRNMLSQVTYDALYLPDDPVRFPLQAEFKPRFGQILRNLGVLSYQYVFRRDGSAPAPGQLVEKSQFWISPVQQLSQSKVLRDRGIKIVQASFNELKPVNPAVNAKRLENWRERWQREAQLIHKEDEQDVMLVRNSARARAKTEMTSRLGQIVKNNNQPKDHLANRLLQTLEAVASENATNQLLPEETARLLHDLRKWVNPPQTHSGERDQVL